MQEQEPRLRVLFVGDDEDTRFMITVLLGMSNYEVVTAEGVTTAFAVAVWRGRPRLCAGVAE